MTKKRKPEPEMKRFEVMMRCVVKKLVTCAAPSIHDVTASPWGYAEDELEVDQLDFEVLSIKEVE